MGGGLGLPFNKVVNPTFVLIYKRIIIIYFFNETYIQSSEWKHSVPTYTTTNSILHKSCTSDLILNK